MAKVYPSRRGRCLHRPGPLWVGPVGINVLPSHRTSGTMRASFPTRWENFAIHRASFFTFRGPLHTRRLRAAPSPSRRGRGIPCGGGGTRSDPVPPHTRQGLWPCHPLPGEGKGVSASGPATLSFGAGFFEIPRKKPFTFGNTYGRISPLVMASITFVPSAQLREKTQGGISPNPILS